MRAIALPKGSIREVQRTPQIKLSGGAVIDTGVAVTAAMQVEFNMKMTHAANWDWLLYTDQNTTGTGFNFRSRSGTEVRYMFYGWGANWTYNVFLDGEWNDCIFMKNGTNTSYYSFLLNGNEKNVVLKESAGTLTASQTLKIASTASYPIYLRSLALRNRDTDELYLNLSPYKNGDMIGLYDSVSSTVKTKGSAGTIEYSEV